MVKEAGLIGLLGLIIIPILIAAGIFASPNMVIVRYGDNYLAPLCPKTIYNNGFEITFQNDGTIGTNVQVVVNSSNVSFIKSEDKLYFPADKKEYSFKMRIDPKSYVYESELNNITISYTYKWDKWLIPVEDTISCVYDKEVYSSNFEFVK